MTRARDLADYISTGVSDTELDVLDGVTAGTVTASKALVVDANKDIATIRNITSSGTITGVTSLTVDDITINGSTISDGGDLTLDVAGDLILDSDAPNWRFKDNGTSILEIGADSQNPVIYAALADKDIQFKGNDGGSTITALTLDMSDAGTANFHRPRSNTAGDCAITVDPSDTTVEYGFRIDTANNAFNIDRVDNATNLLSISADGVVNVGTASGTQPSYFNSFLNVQNNGSTGSHASVTITSGSGGYAGLHFGDSDNGRIGQVSYNNSDNSLLFTANNSTRMTIDSSGKLLIGSSSSTFNGDAKIVLTPNSDSYFINNGQTLSLNRTSSDGAIVGFYKDQSGVGSIGNDGNDFFVTGSVSNIAGVTFANSKMMPMKSGSLADGQSDLGSSSYRWKDLYLSGDAYVGNKIYHEGDTDTYIDFSTDIIKLYAGGSLFWFTSSGIFIADGSLAEDYDALSGTTPDCNVDNAGAFSLTTSGNTTFTFSGAASGYSQGFALNVTAGGTHTLTWPNTVRWAGGTAPDAPASGDSNLYVFHTKDAGSNWIGVLSAAAYA